MATADRSDKTGDMPAVQQSGRRVVGRVMRPVPTGERTRGATTRQGTTACANSRLPPAGQAAIQDLVDAITTQLIAALSHRGPEDHINAAGHKIIDNQMVVVISPFREEMEPAYAAITAAAQKVGMRAERIKDVSGDYRVTDAILQMIHRARFIIADLTHESPNIYFELGYARGLGKTIITILRAGATAHFSVRDWAFLEYFDSRPLENDLVERLRFELQAEDHRVQEVGYTDTQCGACFRLDA